MNILFIYGSPRKNGLTSQMLDIMHNEAEAMGASVDKVWTNSLSIKPCMGCLACRTKGACILPEDDSQRVLRMIQKSDAVIIGAPCYWGNIPGQLKLLFDRMVYGMMRETNRFPEPLMRGKKCILVSSCTTPWPFNILFRQSRGAVNALKEIFRYAGFKVVKTVEHANSKKVRLISESEEKKCRKAVRKLYL